MIFLMSFLRIRRCSYFIKYSAATSCFQIIQLFSVPVTWKFGVLLSMYVGNLFCYNSFEFGGKSNQSNQSQKLYFSMTSLTSRRIRESYLPFLARRGARLGDLPKLKSFSEEKKCRPSKTLLSKSG